VDHVQRQPADREYRDHRDQHPIRPSLPAQLYPASQFGDSVFGRAAAGATTSGADRAARSATQRDGDARVAVDDDDARDDVLKRDADDGKQLARPLTWPILFARIELIADRNEVLVQRQRHRDGDGDHPDDEDEDETCADVHSTQERVNDDAEAVHGDRRRRQSRHVDADPERHRHEMTQRVAERPRLEKAGDRREGDRQQTHHDVGHGQVGDEHVGNGLHRRVARDDVDDECVSGDAEHEDDRVGDDETGAQQNAVHVVIDLGHRGPVPCRRVVHRRKSVGGC